MNSASNVEKAVPRSSMPTSDERKEKAAKSSLLYTQVSSDIALVRRLTKKAGWLMRQLAYRLVENQISVPLGLLVLLILVHTCMFNARPYTTKFYTLAYQNPETGAYGLGIDDVWTIMTCIVMFTGLRAATMDYFLRPIAKRLGILQRKDITRFSEQAWLLIYYSVFLSLGLHIYCGSIYFMSLENMWTGWPKRELSGVMKGYTLAQLSFWMQQLMVIHLEKRRKDHWPMFAHHIITSFLIYGSYRYHQVNVGNVILVLTDFGDLFLPLAKCFRYSGHRTLCDCTFGIFMAVWFLARHVIYMVVCYSVWIHSASLNSGACFDGPNDNLLGPLKAPVNRGLTHLLQPLWERNGFVCWDDTVKWMFLSFLLVLQGLMLMWFAMIIRVAVKVWKGEGADDTRSDAEGGEALDEESELVSKPARPRGKEARRGELDLKSRERRSAVRRQAIPATGINLPSHSDPKELLRRIGCEKQVE